MNVLTVILTGDGHERDPRCIIQREWEIMRHLRPYPGGPVTIDPQPLPFPVPEVFCTHSVIFVVVACKRGANSRTSKLLALEAQQLKWYIKTV